MIAPRRLRLHQEVARALEAQYGAPARRARRRAGRALRPVDRPRRPGEGASSTASWRRSGRCRVYAYGEAAAHLERCLAVQEVLDPDDKAKRCDLLLALGEALMPAGEPLRAADMVAEEAFALADALGDQGDACRACSIGTRGLVGYGGVPIMFGTPAYRRWAGRYDAHAKAGTESRVKADIEIANVLIADDRWARAWMVLQDALELARQLGDPESLFAVVWRLIAPPYLAEHQISKLRLAEEFAGRPRDGVSIRTLTGFLTAAVALSAIGASGRAWKRRMANCERSRNGRGTPGLFGCARPADAPRCDRRKARTSCGRSRNAAGKRPLRWARRSLVKETFDGLQASLASRTRRGGARVHGRGHVCAKLGPGVVGAGHSAWLTWDAMLKHSS